MHGSGYIPPDRLIPRTLATIALVVVALVAGVALRVPGLETRPMHTDEAVHGIKLGTLLEEGEFRYDPTEYHGPTLPYAALVVCRLTGKSTIDEVSKRTLRIVPVAFGIGLLLLLPLVGDGIGRVAVGFAALFTAVSPMMVYYSRYYIMEVLFVFFTFGLIGCGWRYFVTRAPGWAIGAGVCAGLTHATKETCIITFFALAGALFATGAVDFFVRGSGLGVINRQRQPKFQARHFAWAAAAAAATSVLFFSSFFTNWRGVWDSIDTYRHYFVRSEGSGHEQPWSYYLSLLAWKREGRLLWSELGILGLAGAGAVSAFTSTPERNRSLHLPRFLAFYAAITFVVYSAIPYKTPWSIMSFQHAAIVLAGFGADRLVTKARSRWARVTILVLVLAIAAHLGRQAWLAGFRFPAHPRNPYVYAHTSTNFERLVERIHRLESIAGHPLHIEVAHPEFAWPLHWYLRDHDTVAYRAAVGPETTGGDLAVLESGAAVEHLGEFRQTHVADGPYGLRPDALVTLFVRKDLWERLLEEQAAKPPITLRKP